MMAYEQQNQTGGYTVSIIEIKNLTKYYGRSRGIIDVSFTVEEGEIFGFIGPNGAGKSTTIRTLLSLIYPTSGSAAILTMLALNTGDLDMKLFFMVSVTLFFLQLIFLAMGILLSAAVSKIKSVISVSVGTVFGFFILNMLDSILGEKVIRYLTPFKYFDTVYILKNASYETPYLIIGAVFVVAAVAASYAVYSRKDVHAV